MSIRPIVLVLEDFAVLYLCDCATIFTRLMGVTSSILGVFRLAISAYSAGLGVCGLFVDLFKLILKFAVVLGFAYVLLSMMEGKVDIRVESKGVAFSPLNYVRGMLMKNQWLSRYYFPEQSPKKDEIKDADSGLVKDPIPPKDPMPKEPSPRTKSKKETTVMTILRAMLNYFSPPEEEE